MYDVAVPVPGDGHAGEEQSPGVRPPLRAGGRRPRPRRHGHHLHVSRVEIYELYVMSRIVSTYSPCF